MITDSKVLKTYTAIYQPRNGHHHECTVCSKCIQAGERVVVTCIQTEKYYPVKGLMGFVKWQFKHESCAYLRRD